MKLNKNVLSYFSHPGLSPMDYTKDYRMDSIMDYKRNFRMDYRNLSLA